MGLHPGDRGRDKAEAIALVKLLEEQGNLLRRPHSGTLGEGLFELRGKQVRIFYTLLPERVVALLDGMIKKQDAIPAKVLERMQAYQKVVAQRGQGRRKGGIMAAKKTAFMKWIDSELAKSPKLVREVEQILNEMKIEQELVALREKRGMSQRDLARLLGTTQPYVAKLESGRVKNMGLRTLVKCATALGGRVTLQIGNRPAARRAPSGRHGHDAA